MAETRKEQKRHNLTIENRERIVASGVIRIDSFSDELITAQTELGQLNIKGKDLHIEKLNSDSGDLFVVGKFVAMSYTEQNTASSFFGRILK